MRKLPVIIVAACTLSAFPAFAGQSESGPQSYGQMRGGERQTYGYEREGEMRRHGWRGMQEGCKYITIRQRQGDEIIVRHFKRCD